MNSMFWTLFLFALMLKPLVGGQREAPQKYENSTDLDDGRVDTYPCPDTKWCVCFLRRDNLNMAVVCSHEVFNTLPALRSLNDTDVTSEFGIHCGADHTYPSISHRDDMLRPLVSFVSIEIKGCQVENISMYAFRGMKSLYAIRLDDVIISSFNNGFLKIPDLRNLANVSFTNTSISVAPNMCELPFLQHVNLSRNSIKSFTDTGLVCDNLSSFEYIDLSHNMINDLQVRLKFITKKLKYLNAAENTITTIHQRLLDGLTDVEFLNLDGNNITNFPTDFLGNNSRLLWLGLVNNTVKYLPNGIFSNTFHLESLHLDRMELDNSVWIELQNLSLLNYLSIAGNEIKTLDSVIMKDLIKLNTLNISENRITEVPGTTFRFQSNLAVLDLSRNSIKRIQNNSFEGLENLAVLELQENQIELIQNDSLLHFMSLLGLNLSFNQIVILPKLPPSLTILDLRSNKIEQFDSECFSALSDIIEIILESNFLKSIPTNAFKGNMKLQVLNLSFNRISTIDTRVFPLDCNLESFDISHNMIDRVILYPDRFPSIKYLDASHNNISYIAPDRLLKIFPKSVISINLSNNNIGSVANYSFWLPNVTDVDLRWNNISSLHKLALAIPESQSRATSLYYYLEGNPFFCDCHLAWFKDEGDFLIDGLYMVEDFFLLKCQSNHNGEANYMTDTPIERFLCQYNKSCLSSCHNLNNSFHADNINNCCNDIECPCRTHCPEMCNCYHGNDWYKEDIVHCQHAELTSVPEDLPETSTILNLSKNNLSTIFLFSFGNVPRLKELYLNSNNINTIIEGSFKNLSHLKSLDLSENSLEIVSSGTLVGLNNLENLSLSYNRLSFITNKTFSQFKKLKYLNLMGNELSTVSNHEFMSWSQLTSLNISGNPWSCECNFLERMKNFTIVNVKRIKDFRDVSCAISNITTNSTMEYPIADLNVPEFCQDTITVFNNTKTEIKTLDQSSVAAISSVLVIICMGAIIFAVCFWNREFIKLWCFVKFGWKFHHAKHTDDANRPYDAFVCYNNMDEHFVVRDLVPYLENNLNNRQGHKLCVHYRDFAVGASIAESIITAIDNSKRVIMVLSDSFLDSEWCQYEFQTAHHRLLREKKNRIIMILLDEINNDKLDKELKLYLKTRTYVKIGDPWFWQKIEYAMPERMPAQEHNHEVDNGNDENMLLDFI